MTTSRPLRTSGVGRKGLLSQNGDYLQNPGWVITVRGLRPLPELQIRRTEMEYHPAGKSGVGISIKDRAAQGMGGESITLTELLQRWTDRVIARDGDITGTGRGGLISQVLDRG
jgi:hypothetical protein